jgi:UDP-glucose 4-epimerase
MKICVTGGAGFIGSWVAEAYRDAGHDVTIVDNFSTGRLDNVPDGIRLVRCDMGDPALSNLFLQERFDVVNHHAAYMELRVSVDQPIRDASNNILGTLKVFEAARQSGVGHLINISSGGAVYGIQDEYPATELHAVRPLSPYGVAKATSEMYAAYYRAVHSMRVTNLRYTNVYGPRQNPFGEAGVIAIFVQKFLKGETPIINGDGTQTRDYIHVADVVRANMLVTEGHVEGTFNVATGIETDVNSVVQLIQHALGKQAQVHHGPAKAGDLARNVCSHTLLTNTTGWIPTIAVENGIQETTRWMVDHPRQPSAH